jgi:putative ABC transport system permease protein
MSDVRFAVRMLAKNRAFTAVAVLALALGIGANSAIFAVVNTLLLRSLPYPAADRLVMVFDHNVLRGFDRNVINPDNFRDWRAQNQVFIRMAGFMGGNFNLTGSGEPEEIPGQVATPGLFETLRVQPAIGRTFTEEEGLPGAEPVAILSHKLWQRRFGGDPDVVGRSITINGLPTTVIGILPSTFRFTDARSEIWMPLVLDPGRDYRRTAGRYMLSVARLKPGVSLEQAQTEMTGIAARLEKAYPVFNTGWTAQVLPLKDHIVGDVRIAVLVLLAAVALVLLIACANVANLLLARGAARQREVAIRSALGAGRRRIFGQLLIESAVLAAAAGLLGWFLAIWTVDALVVLSPRNLPMRDEVRLDMAVFAFNFAIAGLTGIIFGLAPAIAAARSDVVESLRQTGRAAVGSTSARLRSGLVIAEVALGIILLSGAGLLIRSFAALMDVDPGFSPEQVLTARISLPGSRYEERERRADFFERALEKVRHLPGVQSASAVNFLPMTGVVAGTHMEIEGRPKAKPGEELGVQVSIVDREFFRTMQVRLLRGRFFDPSDTNESPRVYVITEAFANTHFPGENPIGKRIRVVMQQENPFGEIIGVVADIRYTSLQQKIHPTVFYVHPQFASGFMHLLLRTAVPPETLSNALTRAVRSVDPQQPVADVRPMDIVLDASIARARFTAVLLAVFAGLAMFLAALGLYGVMSYTVKQRTQEIGIRMAIGAQARDVMRIVLRKGMILVGIGVAIGVPAALLLTRFMKNLLFGITSGDPAAYAAAALVLLASALLAVWIPARRAMRVDPMVALRYE